MNEDTFKIITRAVGIGGDILQPLLPPSPRHPTGRNAYAHISLCIKEKFDQSYKDISDDKFESVISYIEYLLKNPD